MNGIGDGPGIFVPERRNEGRLFRTPTEWRPYQPQVFYQAAAPAPAPAMGAFNQQGFLQVLLLVAGLVILALILGLLLSGKR